MEAQNHPAEEVPPRQDDSSSETKEGVATVRTISRVPGNANYYEKDGLRTYGDGVDHEHELPVRFTDLVHSPAHSS